MKHWNCIFVVLLLTITSQGKISYSSVVLCGSINRLDGFVQLKLPFKSKQISCSNFQLRHLPGEWILSVDSFLNFYKTRNVRSLNICCELEVILF